MKDLYVNVLIGLGTGVVSGVITGIYSGGIISRRNRFDSLRADLLRHVNSIDYMQEAGHVAVKAGTSQQILYVASELAHFGHRKAATIAFTGNKRLMSALTEAAQGTLDVTGLEEQLSQVRRMFRSAAPSFKVYLPWGQV